MKKLIFILLIIILYSSSNSQTIWYQNNIVQGNNRTCNMDMLNADVGFICVRPYSGLSTINIYKTTNKSVSWSNICNTTISNSIEPVIKFIDENTGFLITDVYGLDYDVLSIRKTTNGGVNWTLIDSKTVYHYGYARCCLPIIKFIDNNTGYICSKYNFFKTTDGGQSWNEIGGFNFASDLFIIRDFEISKLNNNVIYACGGTFNGGGLYNVAGIKKTSNGGYNWQFLNISNTDIGGIYNMDLILTNNTEYLRGVTNHEGIGASGVVEYDFNNNDLYLICDAANIPDNYYLDNLFFTNHDNGILLLEGFYNGSQTSQTRSLKTTDGGHNWYDVQPDELLYPLDISYGNSISVGDVIYSTGYYAQPQYPNGYNTFVFARPINVNLLAKSDYTQTNTSSANIDLYDNVINQYSGSMPYNMNVFGGSQIVHISSSYNNDLFYKWNSSGIYPFNPLNPSVNNYYVDKNGENITANFKTKQKSTSDSALSVPTAINNSPQNRSLVDNNGYLHQVHQSMGGIFYTRSTNGGTN